MYNDKIIPVSYTHLDVYKRQADKYESRDEQNVWTNLTER